MHGQLDWGRGQLGGLSVGLALASHAHVPAHSLQLIDRTESLNHSLKKRYV